MKIVVAVRCYNEEKNIPRFMKGYDFADTIVVSDGGSTDNSVDLLRQFPKVHLLRFDQRETINGHTWNPDAPHMNYVLDAAKALDPDWLIFDDMDDVPNYKLREGARKVFEFCFYDLGVHQVNAFRLYLWGDAQYFPYMNRDFDPNYKSVWGWNPNKVDIHADPNIHHGTLVGLTANWGLNIPYCLLHKSWHPDTIEAKVKRQNAVGIEMGHPFTFAGNPEPLPEWAREE